MLLATGDHHIVGDDVLAARVTRRRRGFAPGGGQGRCYFTAEAQPGWRLSYFLGNLSLTFLLRCFFFGVLYYSVILMIVCDIRVVVACGIRG